MMPKWVLPFKEPRTEFKLINGTYYKYAVDYRYDSKRKRTIKISGCLLGKITEKEGFVPSPKNMLRMADDILPNVDVKTYGVYDLFDKLLTMEVASLRAAFDTDMVDKLLIFSMMRWAHQSPIKRIPHYHAHDYCSQHWHNWGKLSERHISQTLKFFGQNREKVVEWMRSLLGDGDKDGGFVMMDSTHIPCLSEKLAINAKGYNPSFDYDKQVRLMYIFSSQLKQPVYYRLINGNIVDVTSLPLCLEEFRVQNVVFVADKGFYSAKNIDALERQELQYLIPLSRNSALIDVSPIQKGLHKKDLKKHFFYQKRAIWYWEYEIEGKRLITFLDEYLRVNEENDYLQRIMSLPEKFTQEGYAQKLHHFGTLTVLHKTKRILKPNEIYETYKQRNEIEIMFDSYKNFLDADTTHMQDRYVMEGWLLANFIAMTAYYKLFSRLKNAELLSKYSPKDIVEMAKSVHTIKIKNKWHVSETSSKFREVFKKIKIDYLK